MHSPLLLNAICTAAARYLTRIWSLKDPHAVIEYDGVPLPNLTMESAIHYHNKCISHLMDVSADPTNTCSDDALTAITILRYHEQVDSKSLMSSLYTLANISSPLYWHRQRNLLYRRPSRIPSSPRRNPRALDYYSSTSTRF